MAPRFPRRLLDTLVIACGFFLLLASLGQFGYMLLRQHQLRQQWDHRTAAPGAPAARGLRLQIPSIGLDDVVVRGTSYADLLAAPGLLAGSPLPANGGNTVIAAHRDTFFRHLAELRPGAAIFLRQGPRLFAYRVAARAIVKPTDTAVLANTPQPRLTLITCYPTYWLGPAPDRLVVTAARVRPPGRQP
ncbi:MAG TPA: class D sortase [Terriglobales bacterium]|nr:class D sortase [Terriglobales bacterium]